MSEVKVNKISPRTACGTVTLGDSGDTFTIPAGATITNNGTAAGFGATGAASWDTTVKTSGFTAVSGVGYFVNTTAGAITVNLPAGTAGDVVAIKDYANTFDTYNVTLVQNGSDKIGGSTDNSTLSVEGLAVTLVFVDSTQGWLVTDSGLQSEAPEPQYIVATGGTITTVCTDYKVHTFTGPGTFTVCSVGNPAGSASVDYLVVAGGGGSAVIIEATGGGGAGGYRESSGAASGCYTASPLGSGVSALPVSATPYAITVGGGGVGGTGPTTPPYVPGVGVQGSNSIFSTITSTGGGGGGTFKTAGASGGSGGGGGGREAAAGGSGNTPPVSLQPQGFPGGDATPGNNGPEDGGGGGGGATAAGTNSTVPAGGPGGAGATSSINGTPTARAGGGGGGSQNGTNGSGGAGGGGTGSNSSTSATAGTTNTGGGGGGTSTPRETEGNQGLSGGSGIVIIRYKFQN